MRPVWATRLRLGDETRLSDAPVARSRDAAHLQAGDAFGTRYRILKATSHGTIHGIVFKDADEDGIRDSGDAGLPNVVISLDEIYTTTTDTNGEFWFTTFPGLHTVSEQDPPGHTSSPTNLVYVTVTENQTVEVRFGDIAEQDITFQEIVLGNTERALSIASFDTGEDTKLDMDIVLGTHYVGGTNDVLVWWNKRANSTTPNSSLFSNTADYARVIAGYKPSPG